MTQQATPIKSMDAIADILRKHKSEIINQSDNEISFYGIGGVGAANEISHRGYPLTDLYRHWSYSTRGRPKWLMIFNWSESAE